MDPDTLRVVGHVGRDADRAVVPLGERHDPGPGSARTRRGALLLASLVVLVLLLASALAGSTYLAVTNKSRADRWQERSELLEAHVDELNELLAERSSALNARTKELNRLAAVVRRQQRALKRSEADVSSLERRQRELAAEKAAVEDERAALAVQHGELVEVAEAFVACKDGLVELLGYVIDERFYEAGALLPEVAADCEHAEDSLARYSATYG
ncbi:MAG TPA: hypothetical protein VNJ46_00950 [Gaiellaceae bacterium]|nr:hypothetical protein [Gaiellaceae bacterium]